MARLRKDHIVETWISNKSPHLLRYFVTKNHRVIAVMNNAFASGHMMYINARSEDDPTPAVNFRGRGRYAHVDNDPEVRAFLQSRARRETAKP